MNIDARVTDTKQASTPTSTTPKTIKKIQSPPSPLVVQSATSFTTPPTHNSTAPIVRITTNAATPYPPPIVSSTSPTAMSSTPTGQTTNISISHKRHRENDNEDTSLSSKSQRTVENQPVNTLVKPSTTTTITPNNAITANNTVPISNQNSHQNVRKEIPNIGTTAMDINSSNTDIEHVKLHLVELDKIANRQQELVKVFNNAINDSIVNEKKTANDLLNQIEELKKYNKIELEKKNKKN